MFFVSSSESTGLPITRDSLINRWSLPSSPYLSPKNESPRILLEHLVLVPCHIHWDK